MKKELRIPDYLEHIAQAISRITDYLGGLSFETFLRDHLTQDATVRNFEIIGEAAKNIQRADPKFAERYPEFPIINAIGMRNALIHGYFDVKLDIVWKTARDDLPGLGRDVEQVLQQMRASNS